ncbi:unnamed protein product [Rotaria sp. Silwood2]|nr:unnamed protein product [Rotaria sp. Silwood2]
MTSSVQLDIPPRRQWSHGHGYCGETVVQMFGLYNGAWISQQLVRDVNHGEYLIHHVTPEDDQQRRPQGGGGGGDPLELQVKQEFFENSISRRTMKNLVALAFITTQNVIEEFVRMKENALHVLDYKIFAKILDDLI